MPREIQFHFSSFFDLWKGLGAVGWPELQHSCVVRIAIYETVPLAKESAEVKSWNIQGNIFWGNGLQFKRLASMKFSSFHQLPKSSNCECLWCSPRISMTPSQHDSHVILRVRSGFWFVTPIWQDWEGDMKFQLFPFQSISLSWLGLLWKDAACLHLSTPIPGSFQGLSSAACSWRTSKRQRSESWTQPQRLFLGVRACNPTFPVHSSLNPLRREHVPHLECVCSLVIFIVYHYA